MSSVNYFFKPQGPTLQAYVSDRTERCFICGPLGSGKTKASCWKAFRVMVDQAPQRDKVRRTRIMAVRNTYSDLFGTTIKDWLEMFAPLGRFVGGSSQAPTHYLDFDLPDGTRVMSEMIFLALDSEDDVRKLRGTQLTAAWLNEAKEMPFGIFEMIDARVGRYPGLSDGGPTWNGIFGDSNAPDTDHWYYRMAEEDKPEGWRFLKQPGGLIRASITSPWRPNPRAENLRNLLGGSDYYVKKSQGKGDDWIAVNLGNEYGFVKAGKPVYPDFRDAVMVRDFELVKELGIGVGVDFGLFPAAAFGQRAMSGQWRIRRELCAEDVGTQRFAREIKRVLNTHYAGWVINGVWGDPAGGQRQGGDVEERTNFQLMAAEDVIATPACPTNDIVMRVEAFSRPMRDMIDGEAGILIHSDCKRLRKGCQGGYAYRRVKVVGEERYRDMPNKDMYSHIADAGQYLLLGGGESVRVIGGSSNKTKDVDEFKALMGYS